MPAPLEPQSYVGNYIGDYLPGYFCLQLAWSLATHGSLEVFQRGFTGVAVGGVEVEVLS